jgi:prevent-host-death family protein
MQTFSIRDLQDRTGELVREAESGRLSVVTKHGQPVFVAVPFDEALLREGVAVALAARLFDEETISLGKAARVAGMGVTELMEHLVRLGVPIARPSAEELEQELDAFG